MNQVELIRVRSEGVSQTIAFSQDDLNRTDTARQISWQLSEVMGEIHPRPNQKVQLNLDFSDVRWISSAGLNELIGIKSIARSRGVRLVLMDVPQPVRDVFALTRLERMFEFSDSTAE